MIWFKERAGERREGVSRPHHVLGGEAVGVARGARPVALAPELMPHPPRVPPEAPPPHPAVGARRPPTQPRRGLILGRSVHVLFRGRGSEIRVQGSGLRSGFKALGSRTKLALRAPVDVLNDWVRRRVRVLRTSLRNDLPMGPKHHPTPSHYPARWVDGHTWHSGSS